MTLKKLTLLTIFLLACSIAGFANPIIPPDADSSQVTEFEVNGIKVLVKRRPTSPAVAGALFIKGGSRNITAKDTGIENLMLSSAIEGGKRFPQQMVRRELSRTGSGIAGSAGQDYSVANFVTTLPNFNKVWDIFTDVTINPAFAAEDVERNRRSILTTLREAEGNPESVLEMTLDKLVYTGHPYSNEVYGTIPVIQALTVDDLKANHKKLMVTSRLLLVLVGNLDPEDVKAKVTASFGKLPRGDYKDTAYPAMDFSKPTIDIIPRAGLPANYIKGVFRGPGVGEPDYYAMRVAMAFLQGLVHQSLRGQRQLSYAPDAKLLGMQSNIGYVSADSSDVNEGARLMLQAINALQARVLPEDLVQEVAGNFLIEYYMSQETSSAQAGELALYELSGGGWRNYYKFLEGLQGVKAVQVNEAARKYMKNIRFVVIGGGTGIDKNIFLNQSATPVIGTR